MAEQKLKHKQKKDNQRDLFKASFGLISLLVIAAVIFFWVGGKTKNQPFQIPEGKAVQTASQNERRKELQDKMGIETSGRIRGDSQSADRGEAPAPPANETQRAMQLVDSGNWQDAEQILLAEIAKDGTNVQALLELAMINIIDKHDPQSSRPYLEQALKVNPNNEAVVQELMGVYEQNQNWGQAYQFFNSLSAKEGEGGEAYIDYGKGSALLAMGRPQEAAEALQKSIEQGYTDYSARESLATAYESSGRLDDAINTYDQIINSGSYKPDQVRVARIHMATTYISKGDFNSARGILEPMLNADPKDKWVGRVMQQLDERQGNM